MRYKLLIFLITLFAVGIITFFFLLIQSNEEEKTARLREDLFTKLKMQQQESANVLERSWGKRTLFNPINAIEDSKDEFTTYYAYQTASILGKSPSKNYCSSFQLMINRDSFPTQQEGLIFTGIERVYRAQKSMELCADNNQQTMISLFQKHIEYLLKNTYINDGYFISEEFREYKDKPEYIEVKIQQTYMMLYLASYYGLLNELDIRKIKIWVEQIPLKDFIITEAVDNISEILGVKTNMKVNVNEVESLIRQEEYQFNDLIALDSLLQLSKKGYVQIDRVMASEISKKIKKYHFGLKDIQSEYLKNSILNNVNNHISSTEKETLLQDITTYMYDDGMLPTFSSFNNPFSPSLIGRLSETYTAKQLNSHDKIIVDQLKDVDISEIKKQEPFEIYSYVTLFKLTNSRPSDSQKNELVKMLTQKIRQPLDRSNLMSWSFYVKSLINLDEKISPHMLPKNTEQIFVYIIDSQRSYFGKNDDISTLVFLETLANTNLYNDEIRKTKPFINQVEINENSEIAAYLMYYKTMLQEKLELPYDKNKTAVKIIHLFKRSGYVLSAKRDFPDIYSTYFLMNINHELTEDYNHD